MKRIEIASPAKINWFLHVGPQRDDGFHEIETIFQEIDLSDHISVEPAPEVSLVCSAPDVPADERNLAWRAWSLAHGLWRVPPVRIVIEKRIPAGGGLGGGSSNAATVLKALVRLFELDVTHEELAGAALELGSDVPFFLLGGCAYGRGRGEQLEGLDGSPRWPLLLIFPGVPVSTPAAFRHLAGLRASGVLGIEDFRGREMARRVLTSRDPRELNQLRNDLERSAFELAPEVAAAARAAMQAGAPMVRMSGSGSTIWAAFTGVQDRDRALLELQASYHAVAASPVSR